MRRAAKKSGERILLSWDLLVGGELAFNKKAARVREKPVPFHHGCRFLFPFSLVPKVSFPGKPQGAQLGTGLQPNADGPEIDTTKRTKFEALREAHGAMGATPLAAFRGHLRPTPFTCFMRFMV